MMIWGSKGNKGISANLADSLVHLFQELLNDLNIY